MPWRRLVACYTFDWRLTLYDFRLDLIVSKRGLNGGNGNMIDPGSSNLASNQHRKFTSHDAIQAEGVDGRLTP